MKTVICSTALKIGQLLPYYYSYYQLLNLWAVARFVNQIPCSQTSQWHTHTDFLHGKVSHHFRTRHFPLLQGTTHATHTYRHSSLGQNYYSTTHSGIATHIRISLPPEEVRLLAKVHKPILCRDRTRYRPNLNVFATVLTVRVDNGSSDDMHYHLILFFFSFF